MATIESIGSSTRIEGARLSDAEVEDLLSRSLSIESFKTRDEQEVAGYAEAMDLVFEAHADMRLTENHIRQLHQTLLRHSHKDARHRGFHRDVSGDSPISGRQRTPVTSAYNTAVAACRLCLCALRLEHQRIGLDNDADLPELSQIATR